MQNSKTAHLKDVVYEHILCFPSFALICIGNIGKKRSYAHIDKKHDLMFSAWPVHGEGESKKVDVTVAHRKVLLADAEHTTNLQKILGKCKII